MPWLWGVYGMLEIVTLFIIAAAWDVSRVLFALRKCFLNQFVASLSIRRMLAK